MTTPTRAPANTTFSTADLATRTIHRRAVEALIWGIPAVNFDLMYQSHVRAAKGAINQISYWSRIPNWKNQTLTPNPDTIYLMPFFSTKDVGPLVIEIPPADEGSITGTIMNCWQGALEDVGPAGLDTGSGGKYLITPPGFKDKIPDGYLHLPSQNYQGYALLRSILKSRSESDIAKAVAYGKRIKLYPLSRAANPPETTFVDAVDVVFNGVIPYDVTFFESLHRMVQAEPWLERDRAMIDPLKSVGIEQGKPFTPDQKTADILASAAQEAREWFVARYESGYEPHASVQAALWGRPFPEYLHSIYEGVKAGAAHCNYLHKFSGLKTAADRYVNTPNNVSIDAYGNADLGTEPVVISVAALREPRWYIVQIGDMFDEIVYNIGGSRGPEPGLFCLTGPDYHGPITATMKDIKVRTTLAVVANRVFVNGEADIPAARAVQAGIHMLPLSIFQRQGLKYEIPKSDPSSLAFVPAAPEPLRLFEHIGFGMTRFLSTSDDYADPMVASFHRIGLSVAKGFEWQGLDDVTTRGLTRAERYSMGGGRAGYDLALRAAFATHLLGANVPEQLFYPNVRVDAENRPLTGANKYVLRFEEDKIPPVSVFWNMSMYDDKEFFIENDFKRYSIGSTTDGLKTEPDGSITIYIQHENPGADKQSNWLPAPADAFNLTMRLYGAESPILDGSYRLPAVKRTA